jgi:hypothetical protein
MTYPTLPSIRVLREQPHASTSAHLVSSHKLTQLEDDSLTEWILSMDSRGAAPRPSTVREMAHILLAARGTTPPPN